MLKIVILAAVAKLCLSQYLGDDYITCDDCKVPEKEFPEEGEWVCFHVTREFIPTTRLVLKCHHVECDPGDYFCVSGEKCEWERVNILEPQCKLERKTAYLPITQITKGEPDIYQIHSQHYFTNRGYPNNTYCVWNVANSGLVTYHIIGQQLQEPDNISDCDGPSCNCPDSVKITMGNTEVKLCGNATSSMHYLASADGLHVKFCSDNKHTARGFFMLANKFSNSMAAQKREAKQGKNSSEDFSDSTGEVSNATCQYEYMMHVSQPLVPCPDNLTILSVLQHHNHLMSVSKQNEGMCEGMEYLGSMSSTMPSMNKIEMCAVEYLYHTRDCKFAKMVVNSGNKELSGVAHAIINNSFHKGPKRRNTSHTKCTSGDD